MSAAVDHSFPYRLRELRQRRRLSLRGVGELVPCSHVHVRDLEKGLKAPSPQLLTRLDEVLGAGGELAACLLRSGAAAAPDSPGWQPRTDVFSKREADALAAALLTETPTAANALRLAHEWMVAEPPQLFEIRAGRRIGADTVGRIEQRVHQLRLLDDHVGGVDSHAVVTSELRATATLLREAAYTEEVGRRLLVTIGELSQLAGWVASDTGRHTEAQHHYLCGAWAANSGGDVVGAANNLSCLAYQMTSSGDRQDAVVLSQTAARRAGDVASVKTRALLLERVAWAHARADEANACQRVLDEVEEVYSRRASGDDDPSWVYWLTPEEVEIMAGRCWTELRRPLRAVPVLRRATAGYDSDTARETALYLSWLAEALLQAQEVDEAGQVALKAVTALSRTNSPRAGDRLSALAQQFRAVRGVPSVDEFQDAYRSVSVG